MKNEALLVYITRISKLGFTLAGKPKFSSCEGDFGRAGGKIQTKVKMLFMKNVLLRYKCQVPTSVLSP